MANQTNELSLEPSSLQRLVLHFQESLQALGYETSLQQIESWSVLVHECMSGRARQFHTIDHVFDVLGDLEPMQILAILFHDTVYWQVDDGLPDRQQEYLDRVVDTRDGQMVLSAFDPAQDPERELVQAVYGFEEGQALSPFGGLNEFLSALLAARVFAGVLSKTHLAQLAACIEGTIPFRGVDPQGLGPGDHLAARLEQVNERFALGLDAQGIEHTVHMAVGVANSDVGNFAGDTGPFLVNTWKLLFESNPHLRRFNLYTIGQYHASLQKMEGFLSVLDPHVVFRSFRGTPDDESMNWLVTRAQVNLQRGSRYLRAKLVAASLLGSLAELSGGDAPVALFMGDLPREDRRPTQRFEHLIPKVCPREADDVDEDVLHLLSSGRGEESSYDLKTSPLAAYLYRSLGEGIVDRCLQVAKAAPDGSAGGAALLDVFPPEVLNPIIEGCAEIAVTRRAELRALVR